MPKIDELQMHASRSFQGFPGNLANVAQKPESGTTRDDAKGFSPLNMLLGAMNGIP
jgi:hypothetical protein